MRYLPILLSLLLLAPGARGQQAADAVGTDEFPALQFLPAGSVVEGISIPRYENHRVTALLLAGKLVVKDRKTVVMHDLEASLYGEGSEETHIQTESVVYSFATKTAQSTGNARVDDPRFTAKGKEVIFNTSTSKGFLQGPVTTTVSTKQLSTRKDAQK